MSAFFATLIAKIGLNAILGILGTGLFLGIPLMKAWLGKAKLKQDFKEKKKVLEKEYEEKNRLMGQNFKEKHEKLEQEFQDKQKSWEDSLSKMNLELENMKKSAENAKYATLQVGSLKDILTLGLAEVELKGTEYFEEPIGDPVEEKGFLGFGKENYCDYLLGVAQYSMKVEYGIDLNDVKLMRDSENNIIVYGLKPKTPSFKGYPVFKRKYETVLRYPMTKVVKEGKEIPAVDRDECKRIDVQKEYNNKKDQERKEWDVRKEKIRERVCEKFFERIKNSKDGDPDAVDYIWIKHLATERGKMFLRGIFAPFMKSNKEIIFVDSNTPIPGSAITLDDFCSNPKKLLEWHE